MQKKQLELDNASFRASRDTPRGARRRANAGEERVSQKGIPYKVCAYSRTPQTLLFPVENFTVAQAKEWARKYGYKVGEIEVTKNYVRIRQAPVALFVKGSFRTFPFKSKRGVKAIIGCPRFAIVKGGARAKPREQRQERRRAA